jgi:hypothetical protein
VSIRSPCLHLAQQMTTLLPPDTLRVHTRCPGAFSLSVPSTQQHFSVLCCRRDQVLISLAIFFFSHPCSVFAAVSASLMCILSYAYLASPFLFTNLCSDPSFLGADKSKPLVPSVARYASSPHSFLPLPLSDTRWTLPLSLDHSPFTFWLHSFDHLFVNVFSIDPDYCSLSVLYGPPAAFKPDLCASNKQFRTSFLSLVSQTNRSFFGLPPKSPRFHDGAFRYN